MRPIKTLFFLLLFFHFPYFSFSQNKSKFYKSYKLEVGQEFKVGIYQGKLDSLEKIDYVEGVDLGSNGVAVKAHIKFSNSTKYFILNPIFIIKDKLVGRLEDYKPDLGLGAVLFMIIPKKRRTLIEIHIHTKDGKKPI